jgi:hypothetical protein
MRSELVMQGQKHEGMFSTERTVRISEGMWEREEKGESGFQY